MHIHVDYTYFKILTLPTAYNYLMRFQMENIPLYNYICSTILQKSTNKSAEVPNSKNGGNFWHEGSNDHIVRFTYICLDTYILYPQSLFFICMF